MPTQIQLRRGTSTQNNGFTGAVGEVTINTSNHSLRVHDGSTQGGFEAALNDLSNVQTSSALSLTSIVTTGDVDVGGNLTVTGTTTFNGGTLTLGDADTDNVVFGADVQSSILPDADDLYALGSSAKKWSDLHVVDITATGTISGDVTGNVTGNVTGDLTGNLTGNTQINGDLTFYSDDGNTLAGSIRNDYGRLEFYNEDGTRFLYFENTQKNIQIGADLVVSSAKTLFTPKIKQASGVTGNIEIEAGASASLILETGSNNEINVTNGLVAVTGNQTISGTLGVTGLSTLDSLTVTNNTSVGGDLTITGNLQVDGTTTTINSTTLDVDDINITVAKGAANAAAANGAGLTVDGASATLTYTSVDDRWNLNKDLTVPNVYGDLTGDVTGQVSDISNHTTTNLTEGTNEYFTTTRARNSVSASGDLSYNSGTGVFSVTTYKSTDFDTDFTNKTADNLAEGSTNLYYTDARVQTKLGNITGNVIPSANNTYDLGSSSNQWKDLYLSGNSMFMGTTKIMMHADGYLQFNADHSNSYPSGSNVSVATAANGVAATNGFAVAMAIGLGGM